MPLSIISGPIEVQSHGIAFRASYHGDGSVDCRISREALFDLAGYHRLRGGEEELFQALYPEIERLLTAKYGGRRIEEDGELLVASADLLLYGFEERDEPAAREKRGGPR